jgi:hypothetical protein
MFFVVEKDGSLTDIKVIRDMVTVLERSYPCFEKCPKWTPGGKMVKS